MAEITTEDLTEGVINGSGVFDEMQKSFAVNIQEEYNKSRIRGPEYSQVYLGGMQAAMQQAVAFILGRQKADKEAELIQEKITTETKVRDKIDAEIALINKQIEKMTHEILESEAKVWVMRAQVTSNTAQTTPPTNIQVAGGVLGEQIRKVQSEVTLLDQKRVTELSQTNADAAFVKNNSVVGKEILLRQRQADGFYRDAEQKLAKIAGDSYNIQFSTLDGEVGDGQIPGHFTAPGVNSILDMAVRGVSNQ